MSAAPQGRSLSCPDLLLGMGAVSGALGGATWGGLRYGIVGGLLGLPAGAVLGTLAGLALFVALAAAVALGLGAWAFARRGPRGLALLFRYGPDAVARGGPPADTTSSDG